MYIHHGGLFISWVPRLWFDQESHEGSQERKKSHLRMPSFLQYVERDLTSLWVDIGVEHFCGNSNVRRVSWVVFRDLNVKEEVTAPVARALRSGKLTFPVVNVTSNATRLYKLLGQVLSPTGI